MAQVRPLKKTREFHWAAPGFQIKSGNTKTLIYKLNGLDLTIHQVFPDGSDSMFTNYSSPGFEFYAAVIKFLHAHREKLPELPRVKEDGESTDRKDDIGKQAYLIGNSTADSSFPISYMHYIDNHMVTATHIQKPSAKDRPPAQYALPLGRNFTRKSDAEPMEKTPRLEFETDQGAKVFIDLNTARALAKKIPELYPRMNGFRLIIERFGSRK